MKIKLERIQHAPVSVENYFYNLFSHKRFFFFVTYECAL